MSWMDFESMNKSVESYLKALKEITDLCPKLERSNSGRSHELLDDYQPAFGISVDPLRKYATNIYANHESLFEYGRPKLITTRYHMFERFFRISFSIVRSWNFYYWEPAWAASHDEEGNETSPARPAEMKSYERSLTLRSDSGSWGKSWGMKDWDQKLPEILAYGDEFSKELRNKYQDAVNDASAEIKKWKEAMESSTKIAQEI